MQKINTLLGGPFHSEAPRLCLPCLPCQDATACKHTRLLFCCKSTLYSSDDFSQSTLSGIVCVISPPSSTHRPSSHRPLYGMVPSWLFAQFACRGGFVWHLSRSRPSLSSDSMLYILPFLFYLIQMPAVTYQCDEGL